MSQRPTTVHNVTVSEWRTRATRSLATELDTEWLPDPWFWERPGLGDSVRGSDSGLSLHVPLLKHRTRDVTLLSDDVRIRLQRVAISATVEAQRGFSDGVLPYRVSDRSEFVHYRDAAARRRELERAAARRSRVVLLADVTRFFPSVTFEVLTDSLRRYSASIRSEDLEVLRIAELAHGYPLIEGYASARALSNIVLLSLDGALAEFFTRWIDDYRVFCASDVDAAHAVERLETEAQGLGLALSPEKTRTMSSDDFLSNEPELSIDPHEDLFDLELWRPESFSELPPWSRERRLRLLLRLGSEEQGRDPVALAWEARELLPPTVLPRLAQALARTAWSDRSTALVRHQWQLQDECSEWRRLRLSYALWYAPQHAVAEFASELEELFASSRLSRPIVSRVAARHDIGDLSASLGSELASRVMEIEADQASAGPPIESFL